ncbi:probable acyl-[acyl-carrier-protein]--UDP-N-acetylglucosamine O-acyltransferase, mitochondrial isoform X2 [Zingiber officinale]|uniref:probable acyl-[acyl-carrier-protein]--UDP-N-acetylglucosamine O-acyltransferase, mitochondrial isoform X2 n=1 Tax=Zingiber officinale TaxID=94328 RepID=UPI001C4B75B6|nr:probable acyl-[acyl-carrier-protein]--UDP-N-acetylglucosamine O-acyltransferase, mitochondrial isoform X2 [Zingiber officinale]
MLAVSSLRRLIFSSVRLFSRRRFHADFFGSGESSLIHPTSIIHPDAVLGQGVSIGPFCTVGSAVKIGNACQLHASSHIVGETEIGDHCIIQTGAVVGADLPGLTVLGHHNVVGHYAVVGVKCQDLKYKPGDECFLYIGDHNDIREYSSIHRSSKSCDKTIIGDNNLIMGHSHIAHDCKIGNKNIFANNTLLAGHVVVEDYVHTSGAIAVHQFCHIGSHSFIGGGAMVTQDIPKFMMVSGGRAELRGLNLEGLRRHGFSEIEVRGMRKAYQKIFMVNEANSGGLDDRLSQVEHDEEVACFSAVTHMVQSIRESFRPNRRGICKFRNPSAS